MTTRRELRELDRAAGVPAQPLTRRELRDRAATATLPSAAVAADESLHAVSGPAVLRDAPVLPALRPLAELEAEAELPRQWSRAEPAAQAVPAPVPTAVPTPVPEAVPTPVPAAVRSPVPAPVPEAVPTPVPAAVPTQSRPEPPMSRPAPPAPRPAPPLPSPAHPPVDVLVRPPSPWQATIGAWAGVAALAIWGVGPVALGLGGWALLEARRDGHGLGRPVTALVGGAIGTTLGALFLAIGL